jgi:2-hydroxychromene-2-carboxylate isomerase
VQVEIYVDPVCPFAWIGYEWITEVQRHRDLDVELRFMSLAVLNAEDAAEKGPESAWRPVRVGAALAELRPFYEAFGRAYHVRRVRPRDRALREALAEIDATDLLPAADDPSYDAAVRTSHDAGTAPVGLEVGTPTFHVGGAAFFGPVLSAVPRGQAAVDLFDGALLLARNPHFSELKRTRRGELSFD